MKMKESEWEEVTFDPKTGHVRKLEKRRTYLLKCVGIKATHRFYSVGTSDSEGKIRRRGAYEAMLLPELETEDVDTEN